MKESPAGDYFVARSVRLYRVEDHSVARFVHLYCVEDHFVAVTLGDSFGSFTSSDCSTCCLYQTSVSSRSSSEDFTGSCGGAFPFSAPLVSL